MFNFKNFYLNFGDLVKWIIDTVNKFTKK
ncbi:TPA: delta-lysin family phenol-soluble modulin [Staphylococcus aureus]